MSGLRHMAVGKIRCSKCQVEKPVNCFQYRRDSNTYRKQCKLCRQIQNTKDKRRRYKEDPEHFKKVRRNYWRGNKKMLAWNRKYQKQYINRNKMVYYNNRKKRFAERYGKDIKFTICHKLRSRFGIAIKNKHKSGSAINNLGCSIDFFIKYIESRFKDGMSWKNHGKWHIDHIRPLSLFDLTDAKQLKKACHYTNLQPLWAEENLFKGAKYYAKRKPSKSKNESNTKGNNR